MNAKHLNGTTRWGTPSNIVDRARRALGGRIELDPMSEPNFQRIVRAERFYTEQDDAFTQSWICETMLLNPDGKFVLDAWRMLSDRHHGLSISKAIWIGFSTEQLCILADEQFHPMDFSVLICRKRIPFVHHEKAAGADMPDRPSHGNYIAALGVDRGLFETAFAGMGRFFHGPLSVGTREVEAEEFGGAA